VPVVARAARSAQVHAVVLVPAAALLVTMGVFPPALSKAQAVSVLQVMVVYLLAAPVVEAVRAHDRYLFSGQ
jgi:hypothetical protein